MGRLSGDSRVLHSSTLWDLVSVSRSRRVVTSIRVINYSELFVIRVLKTFRFRLSFPLPVNGFCELVNVFVVAFVASLHVGYTMPILFTYCILLSVYVDGSYIRVLEEVLSSLCSSKLLDSSCPSVSSLHLTNPRVHFVSYNGFTQSN